MLRDDRAFIWLAAAPGIAALLLAGWMVWLWATDRRP
jgi:hypothetical protein